MPSLAPLRYRDVLVRTGGPIERVAVCEGEIVEGTRGFCSAAFLNSRPATSAPHRIYDDPDGCGSSRYKNISYYTAISEALERWAFHETCRTQRYGFDADLSTTGMAAYPGLFKSESRLRAHCEAVERWAVTQWWLGRLPARILADSSPESGALELLAPVRDAKVALVYATARNGAGIYGFAASTVLEHALERAKVEQFRNKLVMERFYEERNLTPDAPAPPDVQNINERRLLHFASACGRNDFRRKISESTALRTSPAIPKTLADCEIPGPWSRYATVWRVLYEPSTRDHLDTSLDKFFLF